MILQALKGYYEREKDNLPPFGYQEGKIHFELVLNLDGKLLQVNDLRPLDDKGKQRPFRSMKIPSLLEAKGNGIKANFAWETAGYVLGAADKGKKERIQECHNKFKELHHSLGDEMELPAMQAFLKFLDACDPQQAPEMINACATGDLDWEEVAGNNLVFRLEGERIWLHDYPEVQRAWAEQLPKQMDSASGFCLVSGEEEEIAKLHLFIKGVAGGRESGKAFISFNKESFRSYGKDQNFNSPISVDAAFEYATALNSLLGSYDRKVRIGDATTVFWTAEPSEAEGIFAATLGGVEEDDLKVNEYLTAVSTGHQPKNLRLDVPFYVLGLSPNSARIAVRFWYASTVGEIGERLGQHFKDLAIERQFDNEPKYPGMWRLLTRTATLEKTDNISPVLAGEFTRAILSGGDYPASLLSAVVSRIRAEHRIDYLRAALIKACLVRRHRLNDKPLEVTMSLNKENTTPAYLLGRLFAVLEKTQEEALPGLNATIRDRYIGSASATPRSVFPRLLSMVQHHISKAEYGWSRQKDIEGIVEGLNEFPAHLTLEDQGVFFLGYYHQRNDFFKKHNKEDKN
jgi:CRISPR-associated protein Csd1